MSDLRERISRGDILIMDGGAVRIAVRSGARMHMTCDLALVRCHKHAGGTGKSAGPKGERGAD